MSRDAKISAEPSERGPVFRITLYDELGRYVLTARVHSLFHEGHARAISDYIAKGTITQFAPLVVGLRDVH